MKKIIKIMSLCILASILYSTNVYASSLPTKTSKDSITYSINKNKETLTATSNHFCESYYEVSGYAKDSEGNPIANRKVILISTENGVPKEHSFIDYHYAGWTVITDANGFYRYPAINQPWPNYVYLAADDYYSDDEILQRYLEQDPRTWPCKWIIESEGMSASNLRIFVE